VRAHGHLTKIWAGHSLGNDITSEYAKSLKENLSLRLEEAEKVGTGFPVPAPSCSKISGARISLRSSLHPPGSRRQSCTTHNSNPAKI
jgi:hypothetical protein